MQELRIAQKVELMIDYGYKVLAHFPKSERHVTSQEIRNSMWRILRLTVTCGKKHHKKTTLRDLDIEVELLRRQVRMAKGLGFLPFRKYEVWSRHIDEIGRMLGAWLKHARA